MKSDFLIAIDQLCAQRNLSREVVLEVVKAALISAYKRDFGLSQNISVEIDPRTGNAEVYAAKGVVEEVEDERLEISLAEARKLNSEAQIGETLNVEMTPRNFGRIAAQTAKQVILQRIREAESDALYTTYADREGEMVIGTVQSVDPQAVIISLGKAEAILPRSEQIPGERLRLNQRVRAYVYEVQKTGRGPQILVSRASRKMLRRLLELEVPEIFNGIVEVKAIAREAGSRSKVAVTALQEGVDPVGSCVGVRGVRIQNIVSELNGEKVDVVSWDPDYRVFVANALSPAQVLSVELSIDSDETKTAVVVVPDNQLSLAIGREGQNARLAAKLTGWRIDIKNATRAAQEALRKAEEEALRKAEEEARKAEEEVHKTEEEARKVEGEEVVLATALPAETEEESALQELIPEELPVSPAVEEIEVEEERPEGWQESYLEGEEEEEEEEYPPSRERKAKERERRRALVYDEELGEVIVERKRKPGRAREDWRSEAEQWRKRSEEDSEELWEDE